MIFKFDHFLDTDEQIVVEAEYEAEPPSRDCPGGYWIGICSVKRLDGTDYVGLDMKELEIEALENVPAPDEGLDYADWPWDED